MWPWIALMIWETGHEKVQFDGRNVVWGRTVMRRVSFNDAFEPKLHRYAGNMAERRCHVATYALQFGLT